MTSSPSVNLDQEQYQVRFDWGYDGAHAVSAGVDVIVVVDVLPSPARENPGADWEITPQLCAGSHTHIVEGSLRNRTAVAEWVLARQVEEGRRLAVAVIAVGGSSGDGRMRFAVEDQLGAGAIVDALAALGIDYCSPEAAVACASFMALRTGIGHLVSASVNGRELIARGHQRDVLQAAEVDASTEVLVLAE